jgi:chemotaxis protein MotB
MLARFAGIALLAVFGAGLTGCVSADEHKRLQTAFEESRRQLAESENDLRLAQAKISELNGKIAEMDGLLNKSTDGVGALKRDRDNLQAQLDELNRKYSDLLKMASAPALPAPVNAALRDLAKQYPDLLEFDERLGMLRLKSDLTFDLGSTEVRPAAKAALARVAQILNMNEIAKNEVQVIGHTDDVPIKGGGPLAARNPDNWTLSTNRAWSVLDVLRGAGLKETRGMASGWGDQRPIAQNSAGNKGNEKNRRVDIYIRPTTVPDGLVVSTPGSTPTPPVRATPTTPVRTSTPAPGAAGPRVTPGGVPLPR